jgi:hypothetical protein
LSLSNPRCWRRGERIRDGRVAANENKCKMYRRFLAAPGFLISCQDFLNGRPDRREEFHILKERWVYWPRRRGCRDLACVASQPQSVPGLRLGGRVGCRKAPKAPAPGIENRDTVFLNPPLKKTKKEKITVRQKQIRVSEKVRSVLRSGNGGSGGGPVSCREILPVPEQWVTSDSKLMGVGSSLYLMASPREDPYIRDKWLVAAGRTVAAGDAGTTKQRRCAGMATRAAPWTNREVTLQGGRPPFQAVATRSTYDSGGCYAFPLRV